MKINILFLLSKSHLNQSGSCPIRCRITYKKVRKQFATGLLVNPKNWHRKQQKVKPPEPDAELINQQLSLIKTKLNQVFLFLQYRGDDFYVQDIYLQYRGETLKKDCGVLEVYNLHSQRIQKLVGIDLKEVTYRKYLESGRHLKDFIKWKYKQKDIQIKRLRASFLIDYEYFLKTEKKLQQSTLNKAIQRFRKVIKYAISEDYLTKDPFILYKPKTVKKAVIYLTPEQLQKLEETEMKIKRLEYIKDLFIFCCYTGLGFKEMSTLRKKAIKKEFDGELWITIHRQKTGRDYKVPLLPKAKSIIEKYKSDDVLVFPKVSNVKFNAYLKEIADISEVDIRLTHHVARKTFATTVLLYNDVPMEIVSKLLGHSKLQTTQDHYGEIIQKRISEQVQNVKGKLS